MFCQVLVETSVLQEKKCHYYEKHFQYDIHCQKSKIVVGIKISQYVKGQEAVHFLSLVTFPLSSVDELANQFQNCNQRVCNGDHSPENDD